METDHLAALAVTAALCAALPLAARARPGAWTGLFARAWGALLLGLFLSYPVVVLADGSYELDFDLPLHLTDAVTMVAVVALWSLRPLSFELTWFWGLTASLQAILTPDLGADDRFPSFFYWHYFGTHGGVVVAAVFLAFGLGLTARPGAVGRVLLATVAWAAVAAVGNVLTGGNYMFLREKPDAPTLLDYMGPWPWYIATAALLALALFALLDLPFRRRRGAAASPVAATRPRPAPAPPRSQSPGR
ncbi:MAG: TIGR02206 family membrane protein [Thermoleophilaceae bacterium]|nr:TIGR02206 family membrane protein [Thermoleophilaceae bacterium]